MWTFLTTFKTASQHLPRTALVNQMIKDVDLARFVTNLQPKAIEEDNAHRTLTNFNASVILEYIARSPTLDEGILAFLLPATVKPLEQEGVTREMAVCSSIRKSACRTNIDLGLSLAVSCYLRH